MKTANATKQTKKATSTKTSSKETKAKAPKVATAKAAKVEAPATAKKVEAPAASKPAAKTPKADGKMSGLDAAYRVLVEAGQPLNTKTMAEQMLAKGYWKTGGKTPAATVYAAILREVVAKGKDARFRKTNRGMFEAVAAK
jgi:hypothetical protein